MEAVKVQKDKLIAILKGNRDKHRQIFLEAQEGYRAVVIGELEKMLAEARGGKKIRRSIALAEPMDQTRDYDRAIRMLEMSEDEAVTLSEHDFQCYVLDDWSWKAAFGATNAMYSNSLQSEIAASAQDAMAGWTGANNSL